MKCYMDQTVDPCDRFFDYACGRWSDHHPIPTDKVVLGPKPELCISPKN